MTMERLKESEGRMRQLTAVLCAILMLWSLSAMAEKPDDIDLTTMTLEELSQLQVKVKEEMKNRTIEEFDLENLTIDELKELMVQSLLEMCSREEFVNDLGMTPSGKMYKSLFGKGVSLIFRDTKENYHYLWLDENDVKLLFKTETEKKLEGVVDIQINHSK